MKLKAGDQAVRDDGSNVVDKERYDMFVLWSYVDDSGGRIKWCPGPNCDLAIEYCFLDGAGAKEGVVVTCAKEHSFCWSCGGEPHRPVSCHTAYLWLDTISSREDWVSLFMKRCPNCHKIVDNGNSATNHVTCNACGHDFCWRCLQPLEGSNHIAGCSSTKSFKEIGVYFDLGKKQNLPTFDNERHAMLKPKKEEKAIAMASDYYKFWVENEAVLQEMEDFIKSSEISDIACILDIDKALLQFLSEAYKVLAECLRLVRWVYPYAYYHLDPKRHGGKCRQEFNRLHQEANGSLNWLRNSANEVKSEVKKLYGYQFDDEPEKYKAFIDIFDDKKTEVMNATKETQQKVEKLVTAAGTDF